MKVPSCYFAYALFSDAVKYNCAFSSTDVSCMGCFGNQNLISLSYDVNRKHIGTFEISFKDILYTDNENIE